MNDNPRPRGVLVYPMPKRACGLNDDYALLIRADGTFLGQARMVHTEGVAYDVTAEEPWTWNDYDPDCPKFTLSELLDIAQNTEPVDLANWVHTFGARLETNFYLCHAWATKVHQ